MAERMGHLDDDDDRPGPRDPRPIGDVSRLDDRVRHPREYRGSSSGSAQGMTPRELRDVAIAWMSIRLGATHAQIGAAFRLDRTTVSHIVNETQAKIGEHVRPN